MFSIRFLFFLIFFPIISIFGQDEILNNSLLYTSFPIAYRGQTNYIFVKGYEQDTSIVLVTSKDTLKKTGDFFYYLGVDLKKDTLKAIKNGKVIAQKEFSIENLREPRIFLGSIRDSLITVEAILNNNELIVSYEPQIATPCLRVISFDGFILKKRGKKIPLVKKKQKSEYWSTKKYERKLSKIKRKSGTISSGMNQLNSSQIKLVKRMKSGDILYFQDCILTCPSCVNKRLNINLKLRIK